jgi:hypothetical protein
MMMLQLFVIFFTFPVLYLINKFMADKHQNLQNLPNSLTTASAVPLFLMIDPFVRFARNSFEKHQTATCCLSKGSFKSVKLSTNRKKGRKSQTRIVHKLSLSSKQIFKFKNFPSWAAQNSLFQYNIKEKVNKNFFAGRPSPNLDLCNHTNLGPF